MVMRAAAVLLDGLGSGVRALALAVAVTLPELAARTVRVNVAVAPLASDGRVQVAVPPSRVQAGVQARNFSWPGSEMYAVTRVAAAGPVLAAVRVQAASRPAVMAAGQDRAADRLAWSAAGW